MILSSRAVSFGRTGSVTSSYIPAITNTYDLGSSTATFRSAYLGTNLYFTAASAKIIPGATSLLFRNNADSATNLSITDAGDVSVRAGLFAANAGSQTVNLDSVWAGNNTIIGKLTYSAGNSSVVFGSHSNHPIEVRVNNTEVARIISTGFIIGATSLDSDITALNGASANYAVVADGDPGAHFLGVNIGNDATGATIALYKTRATAGNANTIVQSGDVLGQISFAGADGASYRYGARIKAEVDGTPGASDMPGRLIFQTTADGSATLTTRLTLNAAGNLIYTNASFVIGADSSTNRVVSLCGDSNGSAGSYLSLMTDITNAGLVDLSTGVAANARIDIRAKGANFGINFLTVNLQRWQINNTGQLVQDSTNGSSIVMSKASTGLILGATATDSDVTGPAGTSPIYTLTNNNTTNFNQSNIAMGANSTGATLAMFKTRAVSANANTIVTSGDTIFNLVGYGADGAAYLAAASIKAEVDGTPGTNDMPGRLVFSVTADGASTPTEAMRISNTFVVSLNSSVYTASRPLSLDASKNIVNTAYALTDSNYATATWTDFSGTINIRKSGGAGTLTNITTTYARTMKIGKIVYVTVAGKFDVTVGNIDNIAITLPYTNKNNGGYLGFTPVSSACIQSGGWAIVGEVWMADNSTEGRIFKSGNAVWGVSTDNRFMANFFFEEN